MAPPPKKASPPPSKPLPVVLTAAKELKVGSLITANDIAWSPLKNGAVLSAHMLRGKTKPDDVIGAVVRRAVYEGTPLTWSSIVRPGEYGFLAAALKSNHRAVTIMVNRADRPSRLDLSRRPRRRDPHREGQRREIEQDPYLHRDDS